jgi:hypothetical protein
MDQYDSDSSGLEGTFSGFLPKSPQDDTISHLAGWPMSFVPIIPCTWLDEKLRHLQVISTEIAFRYLRELQRLQ